MGEIDEFILTMLPLALLGLYLMFPKDEPPIDWEEMQEALRKEQKRKKGVPHQKPPEEK